MTKDEAIKRVDAYRDLKAGWDSYSGKPIQEKCIVYAKELLLKLGDGWWPVPTSDGGVQLERHVLGDPDVEIEIYPD